MNKYLFALIVIFYSCRSSRCTVDKTITDEFKNKINLIRSAEERNIEIQVDEYLSALTYLTHITGIPARADYSSTFGYRNSKYYREDMKMWERWFDKNRCNLTKGYVDSALAAARSH